MTQIYLGTIEYFAFPFAPKGWALCNGQTLPIAQNQALFSLLGTTYGGNGTQNFGLPNLQGRIPIGFNTNNPNRPTYALGAVGGEETHKLTTSEIPAHIHTINVDATTAGSSNLGLPSSSTVLGQSTGGSGPVSMYAASPVSGQLNNASISFNGGGNGHDNLMPYTVISACIALVGIYPSRN